MCVAKEHTLLSAAHAIAYEERACGMSQVDAMSSRCCRRTKHEAGEEQLRSRSCNKQQQQKQLLSAAAEVYSSSS
jgi:hypothetical protein